MRDLSYLEEKERRLHVIMTALERYDEKIDTICPDLSGLLGIGCGALVDILARLSVVVTEDGKRKRLLTTQSTVTEENIKILAKNRGDLLGTGIFAPSIKKIVSLWTNSEPNT
jgi:hypothetical protein